MWQPDMDLLIRAKFRIKWRYNNVGY